MDNKTFELLEKMYSDITKRLDLIDANINQLKSGQQKLETTIEHEISDKLQVLFDGHIQHSQQLDSIEEKLDDLSDKVDRHDIKIQVIEGGRK